MTFQNETDFKMDQREFRLASSVETLQEKKTLLGLLCQREHQGNIGIINSENKSENLSCSVLSFKDPKQMWPDVKNTAPKILK